MRSVSGNNASFPDGRSLTAVVHLVQVGRAVRLAVEDLDGSDRDRCLAAGMDAYITKPFTAARLCEAIEKLLASTPQAA